MCGSLGWEPWLAEEGERKRDLQLRYPHHPCGHVCVCEEEGGRGSTYIHVLCPLPLSPSLSPSLSLSLSLPLSLSLLLTLSCGVGGCHGDMSLRGEEVRGAHDSDDVCGGDGGDGVVVEV